MLFVSSLVLAVHYTLLATLCLFGLHRLSMVLRWFRYRNYRSLAKNKFADLPMITVQIPLYNERMVAERIVDATAALKYPRDRLQIQIVDDSTDDTSQMIAARVRHHQHLGLNIQHVQREHRLGYKAGALKDAMATASGELIAIFDADFVPQPSILLDTIDHFTDDKVGMVQFRWEHLNRRRSILTRAQAIMLDAHFSLEQQVRCASNMYFNFNGTAGIWRTEAIIDAGHWSADTLTEDLDLSYRAQMRGWRLVYLNDIACPGELPADMNAFKSQQHRWAKGGIQVMLKMLRQVWKEPVSLAKKLESSFHLGNNLAYFIVLLDTLVFLIPSLWVRDYYELSQAVWIDIPLLIFATGGHLIYMLFGQIALKKPLGKSVVLVPKILLLGIQLAFNNARAGMEALRGMQSEFVRTPKSGDVEIDSAQINVQVTRLPKNESESMGSKFYKAVTPRGAMIELLVALIYVGVLIWAVMNSVWFMLPFLLFLVIGFFSASFHSMVSQSRLSS